jgi:hypothetical protein
LASASKVTVPVAPSTSGSEVWTLAAPVTVIVV